jgi:hypothetical protein
MTFAAWEKKIRLLDEFILIFTTMASDGTVTSAFTVNGNTWKL